MKILLVYYHFEVCGGRYYLDAFKRLGHDVRHIGQQMSVKDAWGLQTPIAEKYTHVPDIVSPTTRSTDGFADHWMDWKPDLILVCDSMVAGMGVAGARYRHAVYWHVPHAVIAIDNHVRNYDGDWAHQFLAHYHGPAYPVDPARKDHSWLPCASDPMFTPSPIPWSEREYDVCCIGVMYPRRQEVVAALREAGLKVRAETGLLYEEYRDAYWNARISLCVSAAGDVAQRIFETGRMGCAILTDPLLDFADDYTNAALHIYGRMTYEKPKQAAILARDLLGHEHAPFEIGMVRPANNDIPIGEQTAQQMVVYCQPHTWDARARVIVDWYEREYGKAERVAELTGGITAAEAMKHFNAIRDESDKPIGVAIDDQTVLRTDLDKNANYFAGQIKPVGEVKKKIGADTEVDAKVVDGKTILVQRKPFLNLGCGRTHFPSEPPPGHEAVDPTIYRTGEWLNVDKVEGVGADQVFDLFAYPWPLEDNSFDGAVLGHLVEHIPHEIKLSVTVKPQNNGYTAPIDIDAEIAQCAYRLSQLQDGWFAFFAELYRVLTPGAIAHIVSPYGWSDGAITDPTHTRLLTVNTFTHGLAASQYTGTFEYNIGCNFEVYGDPAYRFTPMAKPFMMDRDTMENAIATRLNMVYDFYIRLKAVK